jgi:arginyl-tRNA synthetase
VNLFDTFRQAVLASLDTLVAAGKLPAISDTSKISAEPPRDAAHGDIATNAAMVLAKQAKMPPRNIASLLASELTQHQEIAHAEVAGPGFINIHLEPSYWSGVVKDVLQEGPDYGSSDFGEGEKVNVEYVSVNPTGPIHIGHCRGAIFGDALARVLAANGYDVDKEYYFNDAGAQIDVLARSAYLRYREARGEDIGEIPQGFYPGDYLKKLGQELSTKHQDTLMNADESEWLVPIREHAVAFNMEIIRKDLLALGISHDVFFSESTLHSKEDGAGSKIEDLLAELHQRGVVFEGRLPPPKGQVPEDWEDREQTLFRATDFGDDVDRALIKSDGSYTYFAADVAYFRNKYERGYKQMIYVLGADHGGYVKRLEAVCNAIAGDDAKLVVLLVQLVKLFRAGDPVRMSKRAGDFVTLRDVMDEVGPDVLRFMMLYRKNEAPLDFDFLKVTEQSRENPVFYVQYAHARICSVLARTGEELPSQDISNDALLDANLGLLKDDAEIAVIRKLAEYPRILQAAAVNYEPHRVAFYLHELAGEFHTLWNRGKESPQLRFIIHKNFDVTLARIAMLKAVRYVLANGLQILGVKPVEEM